MRYESESGSGVSLRSENTGLLGDTMQRSAIVALGLTVALTFTLPCASCGGGRASNTGARAEPMSDGETALASDAAPPSAPRDAAFLLRPRPALQSGGPIDLSRNPALIRIVRAGPTSSVEFYYDASDPRFELVMEIDPTTAPAKATPAGAAQADEARAAQGAAAVDEVIAAMNDKRTGRRPKSAAAKQAQEDAARSTKHVLYAQSHVFDQRYGRALDELKTALRYNPDSAVALSLMGTVYFKQGMRRAAQKAWEAALKLDPALDDVRQGLEQLGGHISSGAGDGGDDAAASDQEGEPSDE